MKSPFPGMDPYLEKHWRDLHASLIIYARDQLEDALPRNLIARVEERIVFETDPEIRRQLYPNVRVVEQPRVSSGDSGGVAVAEAVETEPVVVYVDDEPTTETFLEIQDAEGRNVITVIEFLNLTNKLSGEGQAQYRRKQDELNQGQVNLVEIDLLRGGRRDRIWRIDMFPGRLRTLYMACVRRGGEYRRVEVYPIPLPRRLPKIRVPLRESDEDVRLDLQPLLDLAYRKGRYADTINYREPCEPPLQGADAAWADELLKSAGKR